ncbi:MULTISPECIES: helix-turn-helix domain-containing protein [Bacillus cereus group]|uniref:helix-turn-helix domain-containing protein n=1 Tax=Bacillus cereus group TaxID=86661 RepID=UPI000BEE0373|nr:MULTISPECIES: helix-turn-helix transcriptional regulator [Bacillus cereus group]MEC3196799.1 helix-turn-helix transcriptional regulator [Bacillus cereus]PEE69398.1 transcriptional regulator [Bacillus thuringiensis]PEF88536.1 transcriptional regulator [Bacillus thuringiensis]PES54713.1 transcriptional regulator [Bacillus thuringiensis]PEV88425.1 transcriptional regulator [Bacillus thuringiensis]
MKENAEKSTKKRVQKKPQIHPEFVDISQKLRRIREGKGLTLVEASDKIGIGFVFLSEIERALKAPSTAAISGIARVYEMDECEIAIAYRKIPTSVLETLTKRQDILRMIYDVTNSDALNDQQRDELFNDIVALYRRHSE